MCGRYVLSRTPDQLALEFEAAIPPGVELPGPSWNVAPMQWITIVRDNAREAGRRELAAARWGLVPGWAKDPASGARAFNARVETVASKPSFRAAFKKRRAVVPADGYFEWRKLPGGGKQPYFVHPADGSVLRLAGLYEWWRDRSVPDEDAPGAWLLTATIITTAATGTPADVHDRMPVALPAESVGPWLDPDLTDPHGLEGLLREGSAVSVQALALREVGPEVGNVRNNGPQLVRAR